MRAVPLPTEETPQEELYHCHVPPRPNDPPISVKVTLAPEQIVKDGLPVTDVAAIDAAFIVSEADAQFVVLQGPSALT